MPCSSQAQASAHWPSMTNGSRRPVMASTACSRARPLRRTARSVPVIESSAAWAMTSRRPRAGPSTARRRASYACRPLIEPSAQSAMVGAAATRKRSRTRCPRRRGRPRRHRRHREDRPPRGERARSQALGDPVTANWVAPQVEPQLVRQKAQVLTEPRVPRPLIRTHQPQSRLCAVLRDHPWYAGDPRSASPTGSGPWAGGAASAPRPRRDQPGRVRASEAGARRLTGQPI